MRTPHWRTLSYALVIVLGTIAALPNILPQRILDAAPHWWAQSQIVPGIDLSGGAHLVLEVDRAAVAQERLNQLADTARSRLREAGIRFSAVEAGDDSVTVTLSKGGSVDSAQEILEAIAAGASAELQTRELTAPSVTVKDESTLVLTMDQAGIDYIVERAARLSLDVVRARIDEIGVADPTIQRVGTDRILVQLPGEQDPKRIEDLLQGVAKMSFHAIVSGDTDEPTTELPGAENGESYTVARTPTLTGDHLADAGTGFDRLTGKPIVTFRFDTEGARAFGRYTSAHVGEPFAIVLDGVVLSAPVIQEPILGGSGQISGHFTAQEASDLAAKLRAGALPAPLTIIERSVVGADLGADAVERGLWTGVAGLALVLGFMVMRYGRWGLIANTALAINLVLVFGVLSWLGATLTLPGIAGIVLGIGMAVDANVLINERIREETRRGKGAIMALTGGFKRAYATIVDANVTTLIAIALLFTFGSGPVRGFAVTMGLSILISMFTSVAVTRALMEWAVRRGHVKRLETGTRFSPIPDDTKIRFMRARIAGIAVSALLSLASVALLFSPGLNTGIDFKGGIQMQVSVGDHIAMGDLRTHLENLGLGEIALQDFGDGSTVLIRAESQPGGEAAQTAAVEMIETALAEIAPDAHIEKSDVVGPKVSGELAEAGVIAVTLAALAMLSYIWLRFEWHFAVGAIATLVLDVTKTLGFFAITGLDFNLTAIAALLTLIGYSVNDKVVVYDRMRENMRLHKTAPLREIIDRSINETLGRSVYTSLTTFIAIAPLAFFGGSAVASFAWPMLFGLVIATSSSIFIAAPILLFLGDWRRRRSKPRSMLEASAQPGIG